MQSQRVSSSETFVKAALKAALKAVLKLPQVPKDSDTTGHYIKSLKKSCLQKVLVKLSLVYSNVQSRDEIF